MNVDGAGRQRSIAFEGAGGTAWQGCRVWFRQTGPQSGPDGWVTLIISKSTPLSGEWLLEMLFFFGAILVSGSLLGRYQFLQDVAAQPGRWTVGSNLVPYLIDNHVVFITTAQRIAVKAVVITQVTGFMAFALYIWLTRHRAR